MRPGHVVAGKFAIDEWVSSGGTATVYRAHDLRNGARVALKLVYLRQPADASRFAREVQILGELHHPRIVRCLDHGRIAEGAYLAMEWLEGETLADHLKRGRLSVDESLLVTRLVAEGLEVAHLRGIVHRDVKPANIFLIGGRLSEVVILDFGIARGRPAPATVTQAGVVVGTPGYMAPEQARALKAIDARADVFSLGCVLWEMLTGEAAFVAGDILAIVAKILLAEVPPISDYREDAPAALNALIQQMLTKDPEGRPRDAGEILARLAALEVERLEPDTRPMRPMGTAQGITSGERRLLSVVLLDARKLGLAEERADWPEALASLAEVVERFDGRLEELDEGAAVAILASTGTAATDQAAKAARLALAMRDVVRRAPMALATGRGEEHAGAWPVGEVIDRAADLLRVARGPRAPGRRPVRLDDVTAGLLGPRFALGGDAGSLAIFSEREPEDENRTVLGKTTPCVGRVEELAFLEKAWERTRSRSRACAVVVTAPPGYGKTRLRQELTRGLSGGEVWLGEGDPMRAGSPFGLLAPALRREARLADGERPEVRRRKLRARVARHLQGADLARVTDFLAEMLAIPLPEDAPESVQLRAARADARLMSDQLRRAWEDFLAADCAASPILLVLEDLHWGDQPTVQLIDAALTHLHDRPLMVLALARPEVHDAFPRLWAGHDVHALTLPELPPEACEELARRLLGHETGRATIDRIVQQSAGNPFFLEELVRAVGEHHDELPETVLAMVQARLEAVDPEARRILRAASVFGEVFFTGGVAAVLGGSKEGLAPWMEELVRREFVWPRTDRRFPGEEELVFRHALTRDAAYTMLTEEDRALAHRLAAEWLESVGEPDALVLAEHHERGGRPQRAVGWYRRAAEQALDASDWPAVLERAERGLACGAAEEVLGALRLLMTLAHGWLGDAALAQAYGLEAMQQLPYGSDAWYEAAGEVAQASGQLSDDRMLHGIVGELLAVSPAPEQLPGHLRALVRSMQRLLIAGAYDVAGSVLATITRLETLLEPGNPSALGWVQQAHARWALYTGDPGEFLERVEAAVHAAESAGDLRQACLRRAGLGYGLLELGELERAEEVLREVMASAQRFGLHATSALAEHNLGYTLARLGRLEEALAAEQRAIAVLAQQSDRRLHGAALKYLARIQLLRRDLPSAEWAARQAMETVADLPTLQAAILATLARVLLAGGNHGEAMETAEHAMRMLESLYDEGEAYVRLTYAETLKAVGRLPAARAAVSYARDRLIARAERIQRPAWRKSFLERVPENARTLLLSSAWANEDDLENLG